MNTEYFKQSKKQLMISNLGNVKHNDIFLEQLISKDGYKYVVFEDQRYYIHRLVGGFIDNPENKPIIDHINNNRTDNRIENLRWATYTENSHNRVLYKNNSSGVKGVYWHKYKKKWYAMICENYKLRNLGYFENKEVLMRE